MEKLQKVFGAVSLSEVFPASRDMAGIKETAAAVVASLPRNLNTFKVETKRADKSFPLTSPEVNNAIGAFLLGQFPHLKVDVHQPLFTLFIEIGPEEILLYHDSIAGPGGLPVGASGKGLLLLSGGIDSPVAGWLAMKRGLSIEALHFHSFPFTSLRSREKAADLCRMLARYGHAVPFNLLSLTEVQRKSGSLRKMAIILLRRMMMQAAEALSRKRGLQALITGESLGQVASQTLEA